MRTAKRLFKFLTHAALTFAVSSELFALTLKQVDNKTHLRWNLYTEKSNLQIEKRGPSILIKTLDRSIFSSLKKEIEQVRKGSSYIKDVIVKKQNRITNAYNVEVILASSDIEVFNFYKDRDKRHVIDFWSSANDPVVSKKESLFTEETTKKPVKTDKVKKIIKKKVSEKKSILVSKKKKRKTKAKPKKISSVVDKDYRDFRYGSSFIWDYKGLSPEYKSFVNIKRKTPEYFYPIKNVDYKKSKKNAHLQLAINYYRKKDYGLMYKTFKLYKEKYGDDKNQDTIEYIKANAIIKDHIEGKSNKTFKMAMTMLDAISSKTSNYDMKKSIYKYLLSYSLESNEYVKGLNIAKKFYIQSKENFDYEETQNALEAIFYNLSKLNQVGKIDELTKDKTILKIIPKQKLLAYRLYVLFKRGDIKNTIKLFEKEKKNLAKPCLESIQFNLAESYFRNGDYKNAIEMFDDFVTSYSYHSRAPDARLRIALSYDVTGKDIKKTSLLYLNTINRSQQGSIQDEAKIRYAALNTVRKKSLTELDLEKRVFLDFSEGHKLSKNLKKLLWQTRLRTFIVDKQYRNALSYLVALPLDTLTPVEKRVFNADGAEVVYGQLFATYNKGSYSEVLRLWSNYKKKYSRKVARDPYVNFVVGRSYLKLGLYDAFNKLISENKNIEGKVNHTFPHWVARPEFKERLLMTELEVIKDIKLNQYEKASAKISLLKKNLKMRPLSYYYSGLIHYGKKEFLLAEKSFENYIASQDKPTMIDPMDLTNLMSMYTESLYKLGKHDKFQLAAKAILKDTNKYMVDNDFIRSSRERLTYLTMEIDAGKSKGRNFKDLINRLGNFSKKYPKSVYSGRVNYLLGRTYLESDRSKEAKKLFQDILDKDNVSTSIKELVKSELSLIKIKERTI